MEKEGSISEIGKFNESQKITLNKEKMKALIKSHHNRGFSMRGGRDFAS